VRAVLAVLACWLPSCVARGNSDGIAGTHLASSAIKF
jgi:hypothetical protein